MAAIAIAYIYILYQMFILYKMFYLKKYNIPLELASVRDFFHTNTYQFVSSQGNVKGHVFQHQTWRHLIFMFYFYLLLSDDSVCKKLE